MKKSFMLSMILLDAFSTCHVEADGNPLITSIYTADPSIHQWSDGRFYLYCSHDKDKPNTWDMEDYHVFSSDDLLHWTDHGVAFHKDETGWKGLEGKPEEGALWAPDAAEKDGRYFLYFPQSVRYLGVAESDSPTGPFVKPVMIKDTLKDNGMLGGSIDPAVYCEDGTWYLIYKDRLTKDGKMIRRFVIETLDETMKRTVPGTRRVLETIGHSVHEGPYIFKRDDTYYLLSGGAATQYFTSSDLYGPYQHRGVLIKDGPDFPTAKTQHNSVIKVGERWILFWHYEADGPYRRRVGADYMTFRDDGSIEQVIPTKEGIEPVSAE